MPNMPLDTWPTIETPRLSIRPIAPADVADLMLVNGDDEVTRFLPYATWQSRADGDAWLARMQGMRDAGQALQLVVVNKASGTVIGTCLLFRHEPASARAEIGYVLGRGYWGRGFMREALAAVIAHAFAGFGLRRLEAEANTANLSSDRLLLKLGFVREGLLRKRWVAKGMVYDTHIYGLLRS